MFKFIKKNIPIFIFLFILLIVLYIGILIYNVLSTGLCNEYNDIKYYNIALEEVRDKDGIKHFPHKIPANAKDIKFYSFSGGFYHQYIFLEFNIDKNYIEQEFTKNIFLKAIPFSEAQNWYGFSHIENPINNVYESRYTYYPINNEINKMLYNQKVFPYFSGIGVNNNTNIFYYFANPEG